MPEQDGQGEAEANTESGEEEEKGGEEMTREEVVQAALTVERWCREHFDIIVCDCPFFMGGDTNDCRLNRNRAKCYGMPHKWELEEFLRNRGLKDG